MYRVITQYRNGGTRPVIENGPWHESHDTAQYWADLLRVQGYVVKIETQQGQSSFHEDPHALASALASMA